MKTNNTLIKSLMLVALVTVSMGYSAQAKASDMWNCLVESDGSTEVKSLETYLTLFNMPRGEGFCRGSIEFKPGTVAVKQAIELKVDDPDAEFSLGNSDGSLTVLDVKALDDETPIITIGTESEGLHDVTIQHLRIDTSSDNSGHGPFLKCENDSNRININNVTIGNAPVMPWSIVGCQNVKINGLKVESMGANAEALIVADNANDFSLVNSSTDYTFEEMTGPVLSISNTEGYTIGGLDISYADTDYNFADEDAVITIDNSFGTVQSVSITNAPMTGVVFANLDDNYGKLTVFESSLAISGNSDNSAAGFILDTVDSLTMTALKVSGFDTGVQIYNTNNSTLSGSSVEVFGNVSYGVELAGSSSKNTIKDAKIVNQENGCGIYFNSTFLNSVSGNNLYNNDLCGVKTSEISAVEELAGDDIIILRQGESSIRVDLNVAEVSDGTAIKMIELHQVQSDLSSYNGETVSMTRNGGRFPNITVGSIKDNVVGTLVRTKSGKFTPVSNTNFKSAKTMVTTMAPSVVNAGVKNISSGDEDELDTENATFMLVSNTEGGSATAEDSLLGSGPIKTTQMPYPIDNVNPNASFFALAYDGVNSDAKVIAIWDGVAVTDASAYTTEGYEGCYWDETSQSWTRINDPDPVTGDHDQDGILNWYEDADHDCNWDQATETKVNDTDTDDDGILDGTEDADHDGTYDEGVETKAFFNTGSDTDGDGLYDGVEDSNFDGNWDGLTDDDGDGHTGETNPLSADSDTDGLSDSIELQYGTNPLDNDSDDDTMLDGSPDEKCPLVSGTENCYYNNCVKADNADVSAAVSSGNDSFDGEADGECDHSDEDDICSADEDTNHNCQWDPGETNANLDDTDDDGIKDGGAEGEDTNYNGVYEPELGESNPVETDSDNDGIADGDEASHTEWYEGSGKGNRTLVDTDGDGIADGDEDSSPSGALNGTIDAGETDPSLADTDSDGTNDDTDICPWSQDSSCVVRYCGVNGYDSYDADSDGLPDKDEDTDGDCAQTKSNKEGSPLDADSDDDGLTDNYEDCFGTNPVSSDTDGDGRGDFEEVESSIDQCTTMFNLGDTNPLHAEFGGCSLNKNLATKDGVMPITIMVLATLVIVMIKRRQTLG